MDSFVVGVLECVFGDCRWPDGALRIHVQDDRDDEHLDVARKHADDSDMMNTLALGVRLQLIGKYNEKTMKLRTGTGNAR